MNADLNQLNETFAAHESHGPNAEEVLAKSHAIARSLKRRQWAVRATSGAVLGASAITAGVLVPGALHHTAHTSSVIQTADGTGAPTPASSPTAAYTTDEEYTAYFDAGYDYNDAQQLAQLWNESGPDAIGNVKAQAGGKLLAGQTLPIGPSGTPATAADKAEEAFFAAGYDYNDAQTLGTMWHETNITQIKTQAGQKLEDGQSLPIQPSAPTTPSVSAKQAAAEAQDAAAAQAFFDAGYTYGDAVKLANVWNLNETYQAKVEGGQKLEKGETLPVSPSGTPADVDQRATDAYFAAGYTYQDAQQLAQLWHQTDIGQVKVEAGQKLENGETLPVSP
jgi:hypothetical protein